MHQHAMTTGSLEPKGTGAPATVANRSHADPLAAQLVTTGPRDPDSFASEPRLDRSAGTAPLAAAGFTVAPFSRGDAWRVAKLRLARRHSRYWTRSRLSG